MAHCGMATGVPRKGPGVATGNLALGHGAGEHTGRAGRGTMTPGPAGTQAGGRAGGRAGKACALRATRRSRARQPLTWNHFRETTP